MSQLSDLRSIPLDKLLEKATERLRAASLDELASLLALKSSSGVARKLGGGAVEDLAESILELPPGGSKLAAAERAIVLAALDRCNGNVSAAARLLGVDRKALERRARRIRNAKKK